MPEAAILKQIHQEISTHSEEFLNLLTVKISRNILENYQLKILWKEFHRVWKRRSDGRIFEIEKLPVSYSLKDGDLMNENIGKDLAKIYKEMMPLNEFIEKALSNRL